MLLYEPNRGYRIRKVSTETIAEAYLVRGALEGLACRLLARAGMSARTEKTLAACVDHGRMLLENSETAFHHDEWREMNSSFHLAILEAASNETLMVAFHTAEMHPMASVTFIPTLDSQPDFSSLRGAQADHEHIFNALRARDATRAASRMREHVEIAGEILVQDLRGRPLQRGSKIKPVV
ncbi:MAG: GntR family transcriptional regulator [Geminicoccaceae bacterium]